MFGGKPAYVFCRVTLPLLARGIFAGWMMTFIISFREIPAKQGYNGMKLTIAGGCGEHGRNCFFVESSRTAFIVD